MSLSKNPTQCPWPRLEPRLLDPGSNALTTGPPHLPQMYDNVLVILILLGLKAELLIALIYCKEKQGIFFLDQKLKQLSIVGLLVSRVWFHYLFQLNFNKPYPISVPHFSKIIEITHTIYQRTFYNMIEYVEPKVQNPPGVNLCQNCAFACTPSFSPRVKTNPMKNTTRSAVNFKKAWGCAIYEL